MGKKPKIVLKAKGYSVYPYLIRQAFADKEGYRGINFRITRANKKGKGTIDLELYDHQNVRIKSKGEFFENGKITGGFSEKVKENYNKRIAELHSKITDFIDANDHISKELLVSFLYGKDASKIKRKRNKYVTIPVSHKGNIIDSLELTSKEVDELIEPYTSKQTFINSDGKKKTIEGVFDSETGETMIQSVEDAEELIAQAHANKEYAKLIKKEKDAIIAMPPKERYEKGLYDKMNIFDVVGQVLFVKKSKTKFYSKNSKWIVAKLLDYRTRFKPKENIKDLTIEWLIAFIDSAVENGVSKSHPQNVNPLNYDRDIFLNKGNEYHFYNDISLQKFIKNIKSLFKHLGQQEILPLLNLDKIKMEDFNLNNVKQDVRQNLYLTKNEIDKLFYFDFKKRTDLAKARDLFILQFWFGGLRPSHEMNDEHSIQILEDGHSGKKVSYIISKDTNEMNENPICTYSDLILKKYKYDFSKVWIDYETYSKLLKEIGLMVFDRGIIKFEQRGGKIKNVKTNVNVEFTAYFARRSFEQTLNLAGINQADTASFTGRKLGLGSIKNYRHFTYLQKVDVMKQLKPERKQKNK